MDAVWINMMKTSFAMWHYIDNSTEENKLLGSVSHHPGYKAKWFYNGKSGQVDTITEAKQIVQAKVNLSHKFNLGE